MRLALAAHDALARTAVEAHRGTIAKMTGDGCPRGVHGSDRCRRRRLAVAAGALRSRGNGRCAPARALRAASRCCRASRQRLLRRYRQSREAHHGGGARRPGAAFAGGVVARCRTLAGGRRARGPWQRAPARSGGTRARLPARSSVVAARLSGAALARDAAEQSAATAHVVHRPRKRARRSQGTAVQVPARDRGGRRRPGQDADRRCRRAPTCWTTFPTAYGSSSSRRWRMRDWCRRRWRRCSGSRRTPDEGSRTRC